MSNGDTNYTDLLIRDVSDAIKNRHIVPEIPNLVEQYAEEYGEEISLPRVKNILKYITHPDMREIVKDCIVQCEAKYEMGLVSHKTRGVPSLPPPKPIVKVDTSALDAILECPEAYPSLWDKDWFLEAVNANPEARRKFDEALEAEKSRQAKTSEEKYISAPVQKKTSQDAETDFTEWYENPNPDWNSLKLPDNNRK
jgi:hypothetical protein